MTQGTLDFQLESSVLFRSKGDRLEQQIDLHIHNSPTDIVQIRLQFPGQEYKENIVLKNHSLKHHLFVPEIKSKLNCKVHLIAGVEKIVKEVTLMPQKKWEAHVVHFSHTDTGYTDLPSRVAKKYGRFIKNVLDYCRKTDNYPDDAKFRWTFETGYQFKMGWQILSLAEQKELLEYMGNGRVELSAIYMSHNSELYDHELLLRSILDTSEFCRLHELPLKSAMNTDVTGQPWAMVQILAQSGINFLSMAVNETRGRQVAVPRAFYWESQDKSKILVWNSDPNNAYIEGATLGITTDYETVLNKLPRYLKRFCGTDFPYDIIGFRTASTTADNAEPILEPSGIIEKWNENWAFPRLIFSTNTRFMESFENRWREKIPVFCQAWPDYWVDLFGSVTRETGICRIAHSDISTGETLNALNKVCNPEYRYPVEELNDVRANMLVADELDWCASEGVTKPDSLQSKGQYHEQASFVYRGAITAKEVKYLGEIGLLSLVKSKAHHAVVFNPLSWERTDVVKLAIPIKYLNKKNLEILDQNGNHRPYQEIESEPLNRVFLFHAENIPALGYKTFKIETTDRQQKSESQTVAEGDRIENQFYRIKFATDGSISSIFDKELNRDIVNSNTADNFYQVIYEQTIGGRPKVSMDEMQSEYDPAKIDLDFMEYMHRYSPKRFPERDTRFKRTRTKKVKFDKSVNGSLFSEQSNTSLLLNISRLRRSVILFNDIKRIELSVNLDKEEKRDAEAIYLAFPFLLENFKFEIENAYSFLEPEEQQLPDSCRDWYLAQKWIRLYNQNFQIFWSAIEGPLVQLSGIQSGKWLHHLDLSESSIYSWLFNNYWWTNIPASQGGWNYKFRYAIGSDSVSTDRISAIRFGWDYHLPLRSAFIEKNQSEAPLPDSGFSFCEINPSNVIITAVKQAENTDGLILRLFEVEGKETETNLIWNGPKIKYAFLSNPVERDLRKIKVGSNKIKIQMKPYRIVTIRLLFDRPR